MTHMVFAPTPKFLKIHTLKKNMSAIMLVNIIGFDSMNFIIKTLFTLINYKTIKKYDMFTLATPY